MIQYKLIEEYPGHSLGEIHTADKGTKWYGTIFYDANPKFWQKVEEVDYEILEIKGVLTGIIHKYDGVNNFETILRVSDCFTIHSVKRLSDGEVFTIGDETSHGTISSIEIHSSYDGGVLFRLKGKTITICLATALKLPTKTPLFTTEDGVNVFEGDKFFWVDRHSLKLGEYTNIYTNIPNTLYFSTRPKAVEYILLNKPCLSLNDLLSAWGNGGYYKDSILFKKFEKLAKSKL